MKIHGNLNKSQRWRNKFETLYREMGTNCQVNHPRVKLICVKCAVPNFIITMDRGLEKTPLGARRKLETRSRSFIHTLGSRICNFYSSSPVVLIKVTSCGNFQRSVTRDQLNHTRYKRCPMFAFALFHNGINLIRHGISRRS